jgi:hypothetical protein
VGKWLPCGGSSSRLTAARYTSSLLHSLFGQAGLEAVDVASFDLTQPPPDWAARVEAVERELQRQYGDRPELKEADEQSGRIGKLLRSGEVTSQVILLQAAVVP